MSQTENNLPNEPVDTPTEENTPKKQVKPLDVVRTVFTWAVVAFAVFIMVFTVLSVSVFDKGDRDIFGYRFYIVRSDSMSATDFSAGDIILTKEVDAKTLKEGDIISFISQNEENFGETVTHKIKQVTKDANGLLGFVTYGTTTGAVDETVVTYTYVLGKYVGRLPGVGRFFNFLKTTPGYLSCIFVPFMLLIVYQGIASVRLFRQYKREQMAELEAERKAIEEERRLSMEMMKELQELKAQLAGSDKNDQKSSD